MTAYCNFWIVFNKNLFPYFSLLIEKGSVHGYRNISFTEKKNAMMKEQQHKQQETLYFFYIYKDLEKYKSIGFSC